MKTHTRLTGRATDLSLGGCYVDVISPFAEKSAVRLRLTSEGHSFITPAVVTYSLNGMGMGLMFVNIPSEQAEVLRNWVEEMSEDPAAVQEHTQDGAIVFEESPAFRSSMNMRNAALDLIAMLVRKQVLTEFEAQPLRDKLTR